MGWVMISERELNRIEILAQVDDGRLSVQNGANMALEAIREELTTAELAKKYDIHPTMISGWKKTAIENMASAFDGKVIAPPPISEKEVEKLHAKIGQLFVERDFLAPSRA